MISRLAIVVAAILAGSGSASAQSGTTIIAGDNNLPSGPSVSDWNVGAVNLGSTMVLKFGVGEPAGTRVSVSLTGPDLSDFKLVTQGKNGGIEKDGETSFYTVNFRPTKVGAREASLHIFIQSPNANFFITNVLKGTGKKNTAPVIASTPLLVDAFDPSGAVPELSKQVSDVGEVRPLKLTFNPKQGTKFRLGDTEVTATATDAGGLTTRGKFIVRVRDAAPPVFTLVPQDIVLDATSTQGAMVTYPPATASDAVSATTLTYSPASGSFFPLDQTWVRCTATDEAGNATSRWFRVTVRSPALEVTREDGRIFAGSAMRAQEIYPYGYSSGRDEPLGVVDVSLGYGHEARLLTDGTVVARSSYYYSNWTPVVMMSDVAVIASGVSHLLALKRDGTVVDATTTSNRWSTVPTGVTQAVAIAAGDGHNLALLQDGTLVAWGDNRYGQATVPSGLSNIKAIFAAGGTSVAIKQDGSVIVWGLNAGRLQPPTTVRDVASAALGLERLRLVKQDGSILEYPATPYLSPPKVSEVAMTVPARSYWLSLRHDGSLAMDSDLSWGAGFQRLAINNYGDPVGIKRWPADTQARETNRLGNVNVGSTVALPAFTLHNRGTAPLEITGISITGDAAADFNLDMPAMTTTLPIGGSTTFNATFAPTAAGVRNAFVHLLTNAPGATVVDLPLHGTGKENTAPALILFSQLVEATGPDGAIVSFSPIVTDDGEPVAPKAVASPVSGSLFPIGDTTVQVSATDAGGLTTTDSFVVSVRDRTAPNLIVTNLNTPATQNDGGIALFDAIATDAVGVTSVTCSRNSGTLFPIGVTTVTATARDAAGNETTRSFNVTVSPPGPWLEVAHDGLSRRLGNFKNKVVSWGAAAAPVPAGLTGVVSIAASATGSYALLQDGTLKSWGTAVALPANEGNIVELQAAGGYVLALKRDGSVAAWGQLNTTPSWNGPPAMPYNLSNVVALATSGAHALALDLNGVMTGWGSNGSYETGWGGFQPALALAAGDRFSMALNQDGTVDAWGNGSSTVPASLHDAKAIMASGTYAYALRRDGTVTQWSQSGSVPALITNVSAMAANAPLFVLSDGHVSDGRQLVGPGDLANVTAVAAGSFHSLALCQGTRLTFGTVATGYTGDQSLVIANQGIASLQNVSAQITGLAADEFSVITAPPTTLTPGSDATITVRFTPKGIGPRFGTLRLSSNDPELGTFDVLLLGKAGLQNLALENQSWSYSPLTTQSFFTKTLLGAPSVRSLRLRNTGTGLLEQLWVSIDGPDAPEFTTDALASDQLEAGAAVDLLIRFRPRSVGKKQATLHIHSNDPDKPVLDFPIECQCSGFDLNFTDSTFGTLNRGSGSVSSGWLAGGAKWQRSFTIRNVGPDVLTGLRASITGDDLDAVTITPALPSTLATGESFTFTVTFSAIRSGYRQTTVQILSNRTGETSDTIKFYFSVKAPQLTIVGHDSTSLPSLAFAPAHLNPNEVMDRLTLQNQGNLPLSLQRLRITGTDASLFRIASNPNPSVGLSEQTDVQIAFRPLQVGSFAAELRIETNDPLAQPFVLPITAECRWEMTAQPEGTKNSPLTFGPLRLDSQTGLMLRRIAFANISSGPVNTLRLVMPLSHPEIAIYSSSKGPTDKTVEVLYTHPVAAGETVSFDLVSFDPMRRISPANPSILATALATREPVPGPVLGALVPLLSVRDTASGPLLEWNAVRGQRYVVEYSDDGGTTWSSAVHQLTGGARLFWVDRGQPETYTRPASRAARSYRVKRL